MAKNYAVIGDGGMGTICAVMLAENGKAVYLWSAFPDQAADLQEHRENRKFLPGLKLPDSIEVICDDATVFDGVDAVISAVPTQFMRGVWMRLKEFYPAGLPICSITKGIEVGTGLRPTQIIEEVLGASAGPVAVLSGPSIAPEIARKLPASVTVACTNDEFAREVQTDISRPYFRVYTSGDVIGVELAGATKNVIAIAAGILDGMKMGDNAKAALLARGLSEITRLGVAAGATAETFAGLSGMGDLVTTCISPVGRNRSFGQAVGEGCSVEEALARTQSVVEGVATTRSVLDFAKSLGVEMPITQGIYNVLFEGAGVKEEISHLMTRPLKAED